MLELFLSKIGAIAELERVKYRFEYVSDTEVRLRCPFHEDTNPSCSLNIQKRVFKCHSLQCPIKSGDLITLLAGIVAKPRKIIIEELEERYGTSDTPTIPTAIVERAHEKIWLAKPLLRELRNRGITDDDIRRHRLGEDSGRITIPIFDEHGNCVNLRRYLPGAPGRDKMRNTRGRGQPRLFPIDQLKFDEIVICGGEMKAIAVASRLNSRNIGGITVAAGEGAWKPEFTEKMRNKRVYVCMDVDPAGRAASEKLCANISQVVEWVKRVDLPLDVEKYPKGDVNDYFGSEGRSADDFHALLEAAPRWTPKSSAREDSGPVTEVRLDAASDPQHVGKRISVTAVVSLLDTQPFLVPSVVGVACDRAQPLCSACPIFACPPPLDNLLEVEIRPESQAILEMIEAPKKAQRDAIREALGIPLCKSVEFIPKKYYSVESTKLVPQLEITSRDADNSMASALVVGKGLEANCAYKMKGRVFPHPRNQQAVMLMSEAKPAEDALTSYDPNDEELEELEIFCPANDSYEALDIKLNEIYEDLEANVTRIYMRRSLHVMIDMAFHSCLLVPFDGSNVKGWVEVLVVGDSSQGKSETAAGLMRHYRLGEKIECKNASVAGLLGGLKELAGRWYVSWGVIPTHDRRLVVLEELKGAPIEVIGKLTDMRSSGVAEIPKIEKRRTHARTRLVALSNPRSNTPMSSYNFGVEAILELVGSPEDVRRFDACCVVASEQIDRITLEELMHTRPNRKHVHVSDLCRKLVLWSWSRKENQVILEDGLRDHVLKRTSDLCRRFSEQIPIVDKGSMRYKLIRLSTAIACRTFSHPTDDLRSVLVRKTHVDWVADFLIKEYEDSRFGYGDYSAAVKITEELIDPDVVERHLALTSYPVDVAKQLLHTSDIELRDICDWCGYEREDGLELLSLLVRKHALVRCGRAYRKTGPFIQLLKSLITSGRLERPGHVKKEKF